MSSLPLSRLCFNTVIFLELFLAATGGPADSFATSGATSQSPYWNRLNPSIQSDGVMLRRHLMRHSLTRLDCTACIAQRNLVSSQVASRAPSPRICSCGRGFLMSASANLGTQGAQRTRRHQVLFLGVFIEQVHTIPFAS